VHGLLFLPAIVRGRKRKWRRVQSGTPTLREWRAMAQTFFVLMLTNALFRSPNLSAAAGYFVGIFSWPSSWSGVYHYHVEGVTWALIAVLMGAEALQVFYKASPKRLGAFEPVLWAVSLLLFLSSPGFEAQNQFIYFDF
jgi:D-alanyl-lipoteichoic acid acyltransferase DltB (MBOAT superfamily)